MIKIITGDLGEVFNYFRTYNGTNKRILIEKLKQKVMRWNKQHKVWDIQPIL